ETAKSLGMPLLEARLHALATPAAPATERAAAADMPCRLIHEGDFWTVSFDGSTSRIRDAKGMRYLRLLVANPGQEFHVLAMVADIEGRRGATADAPRLSEAALERLGMHRAAGGDAGLVLDAQARAAYRSRMADLEADRDEAEAANDIGRYDRAVAEIDF